MKIRRKPKKKKMLSSSCFSLKIDSKSKQPKSMKRNEKPKSSNAEAKAPSMKYFKPASELNSDVRKKLAAV